MGKFCRFALLCLSLALPGSPGARQSREGSAESHPNSRPLLGPYLTENRCRLRSLQERCYRRCGLHRKCRCSFYAGSIVGRQTRENRAKCCHFSLNATEREKDKEEIRIRKKIKSKMKSKIWLRRAMSPTLTPERSLNPLPDLTPRLNPSLASPPSTRSLELFASHTSTAPLVAEFARILADSNRAPT